MWFFTSFTILLLIFECTNLSNAEYFKAKREYHGIKNYEEGDNGMNLNTWHPLRRIVRSSGARYRREPKIWDQWSTWSSCSVTCGVGKLTRWRHCIDGSCLYGEKKAQLKTCTFPACKHA